MGMIRTVLSAVRRLLPIPSVVRNIAKGGVAALRDTCEQNDGVQNFGWTMYDPRAGGSQAIRDKELGVDLTTEFVKNEDGSGWAVRVSGAVRPDAVHEKVNTSLIFHVAMEKTVGSSTKGLLCERLTSSNGHVDGAMCRGKDTTLGNFDFRVNADPKDHVVKASFIRSKRVAEDKIWQAKSVYLSMLKKGVNKDEPGAGNMHLIRFDFEGSFSATFSYRDEGGLHLSPDAIIERLEDLSSSHSVQVHKAFPRTIPFRDTGHAGLTEALLSNLLGGMGFFHGDSKVSQMNEDAGVDIEALVFSKQAMADTKITTTKPSSLLSFTPSRSFFPRGFLWDEGFHLLPVLEWDIDLAVSVLSSWLNRENNDGWIAREQILGDEARSRVPEQFRIQYPHHANPPTFLALVLPALFAKLTSKAPYNGHTSKYLTSHDERTTLLKKLYPALSQYYMHFRRTQAGTFNNASYPRPEGTIDGEGFRWRGRTAQHTLTSGLDDYPRAPVPSPGELHVDALAWVGASAKALLEVAEYLSLNDEASVYRDHLRDAQYNLDVLHWSDREEVYCDSTVDQDRYAQVCHIGYVSFMPLLLGLVNSTHPRLPALLSTLADPSKLWSQHGLRSLSMKDEYYGKDENYWRGAVWMNLNSLAVLRLHVIGTEDETPSASKALKLAEELRAKVVSTVYTSWITSGFVWEQYVDESGEGRRSKGFTGWTATVLLLMGLRFGRDAGDSQVGGSNTEESVVGGSTFTSEVAGQMVSTKMVVLWAAVTLLMMLLRRRLLRFMGRIAGAWRARRRGSGAARILHGGKYEEGIPMEDRKE
ncbi:Processing alpha glucosidase I [Gnomoniopsis smithogilvyi]|uniref:Mannosyl-oligosaccharide glucosidase n=1 Tax=Gnomoniopsis smithogilvyi TaxID=1191159 RepID=A0A9W9CV38_9PEZI|nr:Processing alpha glucosidase I [Gnomoniopsis smithogilvyi]